jgi:hypothetical protein
MSLTRRVLLLLVPLAALAIACTSYEPPKRESALAHRETGMRQDCNAMMGTAFRGAEERTWFEENCSKWPAVAVAQIPPAPAAAQPGAPTVIQGETPECAAMRGRPYGNEQERTWFLTNCLRQEVPAAVPPGAPPAASRPVTAPPAPLQNSTAQVCDTLRRTPNPTDEQRRWYFTYCDQR